MLGARLCVAHTPLHSHQLLSAFGLYVAFLSSVGVAVRKTTPNPVVAVHSLVSAGSDQWQLPTPLVMK